MLAGTSHQDQGKDQRVAPREGVHRVTLYCAGSEVARRRSVVHHSLNVEESDKRRKACFHRGLGSTRHSSARDTRVSGWRPL